MAPVDLHAFWQRTIEALQHTPLNATLTDAPEHSGREYVTTLVQMDSFQGKRLRAWYAVPKDPTPGGKLPAVLAVPGYGGDKPIPIHLVVSGFAVLTLYPRGQGESRQEWELEHSTKLTYHVTDKEQFYYRGAYMDCVRGLDFLASRPEVDATRLGMWSRSQGGGLTLATAALDHRLRVAVAEEPFLCNYPVAITLTSHPYGELHDYATAHPEARQAILDTLAYFDPLHIEQCFGTVEPAPLRATSARTRHGLPYPCPASLRRRASAQSGTHDPQAPCRSR